MERKEQIAPYPKVRPNWLKFGLRALVTVGILAPLLFFHPGGLLVAMKKTGFVLWASVVASTILCHVILAAKWRILLKAAGNGAGSMDSLRAHGAGLFANICLPSLIGGDVVRTGMISRDAGSLPSALTGVVADRLTDIASLIILAAAGMLLLPSATSRTETRVLILVAGLLGLGMFLATITIKRINPKRFPTRIARTLEGLKDALAAMSRKKAEAILALLITTSIQGLFIFLNVLIADKIGIHVPVAVWLIAFPLAKMVAFLPLSLGGLGVREGVVAAVLLPFSVPTALAIAQSLVWQTVTFAVGILGGMIALWIGYRKPRPQVA